MRNLNECSKVEFEKMIEGNEKLRILQSTFEEDFTNYTRFNACIGWEGQDFGYGYIEGFYMASQLVIENSHDFGDYYVYPVMFNFRQYIELALKDLLLRSQIYFEVKLKPKLGHDIEEALNQLCNIFDHENLSFFIPNEVRDFILEFYRLDTGNDRYRYPYNRQGNLSNEYGSKTINLKRVGESMKLIHEYLETIRIIFDEESENIFTRFDFVNFIKSVTEFSNANAIINGYPDRLYEQENFDLKLENFTDNNIDITLDLVSINKVEANKNDKLGTIKYFLNGNNKRGVMEMEVKNTILSN